MRLRLLIRLVAIILPVILGMMALLVTGVRAAALQQSAPLLIQVLLPDAPSIDCPAPCWRGINTDEADHLQTTEMLNRLPNATQNDIIEWEFWLDAGQKQQVRLERGRDFFIRLNNVRLGDMLVGLGFPDFQIMGRAYDQVQNYSGLYVSFYYEDYRLIMTLLIPEDGRLSAQTPVARLVYPTGPFEKPESAHTWLGLIQIPAYPQDIEIAPFLRLE